MADYWDSPRVQRQIEAGKEWARGIHREALSLVSDEWEYLPQIMERKESDTRPDLIRRALLDNSSVEKRSMPPAHECVGSTQFRRRGE